MQQLVLHKKLYQIGKIDETAYSSLVYERLEKINFFKKKISRSTLYRWKKKYKVQGLIGLENESTRPNNLRQSKQNQAVIQLIAKLRKQNPLYGKEKIKILLQRDHKITLSVSTVGRTISDLIKRNQIKSAYFYYAKKRVRPRIFNKHAQRWKYGMKSKNPGELFQIDHMSVPMASSFTVKHFQGICPITKVVVEQVYSCATSSIAKQFLEYAQSQLPFKITSIQVDGGSEFMKDFELACKDMGIPLYVLPPRSPKYNGTVERANGAAKFEFYFFYDGILSLLHLRKALQSYVHKYNNYRPHQALQYLTPLQYFHSLPEAANFSHMY
jgi:hypothetical protein